MYTADLLDWDEMEAFEKTADNRPADDEVDYTGEED